MCVYDLGIDVNMWNTTTYHKDVNLRPWVGPNASKMSERGVRFATVRASSGLSPDRTFLGNVERLQGAQIEVIAYHWFDPRLDAVAQADVFLSAVRGFNFPRMIDLEDTKTVKAWKGIFQVIKRFLDRTGSEIIYLNPAYMAYWKGEEWVRLYKLIIAHWDVPFPKTPKPWHPMEWYAWQYTAKEDGSSFGLTTAEAAPYIRRR